MSEHKLVDRARGRWREILTALGVDDNLLDGRQHACPVCRDGKDRFTFDDEGGEGTWICRHTHGFASDRKGVATGKGIALVMDLNGTADFVVAARLVEGVIGKDSSPIQPSGSGRDGAAGKAAFIQKVIADLRKASLKVSSGDPVDMYLRSRIPGLKFTPAVLRTVMSGEHRSELGIKTFHPLMLANVTDLHGDLIAVHRTYLTIDGHKAPVDPKEVKMNLGPLPDGVAIRLAKPGKILGVAEGIETALSAMAIHRIPVWSTMNEGRLEAWQPPEGITEVVIFGDNDLNSVGQAAAYALSARLNKSIIAQVAIPPDPGTDWNDVHTQQRTAA